MRLTSVVGVGSSLGECLEESLGNSKAECLLVSIDIRRSRSTGPDGGDRVGLEMHT